jgi:uncharacterized protein
LFFITQIGFAQLQYQKPSLATSVYDYANVLSSTKNFIRRKLIHYSITTTQIVVITIESLKGEEIYNSAVPAQTGESQAKEDNGCYNLGG